MAMVAMTSLLTYVFLQFDFLSTQSADGILRDSQQMLPVSKSRAMTTVEASQVGVFSLGKGGDVCTSFNRQCRMGGGRQEWRMRALCVAGSSVLSG